MKNLKLSCINKLKLDNSINENSDSNTILIEKNEMESQENQLKLSENKIKSMGEIAAYRNTRIKNILDQTKLVNY